jgi:hypothetical protein
LGFEIFIENCYFSDPFLAKPMYDYSISELRTFGLVAPPTADPKLEDGDEIYLI